MHQIFANFAMVDQFATIKSAKPILLLVDTHDPCQNADRKGSTYFSADLAHWQRFSPAKYYFMMFADMQNSNYSAFGDSPLTTVNYV